MLETRNETIPTEAIFYLFRNGLGETYQALAQSKTIFMESQQNIINQTIETYYIYLILVLAVLLVTSAVSIPIIRSMHRTEIELSRSLLDHPVSVYYEHKRRVVERLQTRYDSELDLSIEHSFKGNRHIRSLYNPVCFILILIVFLWVICISFYLPFYFKVLPDLSQKLTNSALMLTNDSTRLVSIIELFTWTIENFLLSIGHSMFQLIPEHSIIPAPIYETTPAITRYKDAAHVLLILLGNGFPITESHFQFIHESTPFTSPYFQKGYRPGCIDFINELLFCLDAGSVECTPVMNTLQSTVVELASNSYNITSYYSEDIRLSVSSAIVWIEAMLTCFSMLLLLLLLALVLLVKLKVYNVGKAMLKLKLTMQIERSDSINKR